MLQKFQLFASFKISQTSPWCKVKLKSQLRKGKTDLVGAKKYPLCKYKHSYKDYMYEHFKDVHKIFIEFEILQFDSKDYFLKWESKFCERTGKCFWTNGNIHLPQPQKW